MGKIADLSHHQGTIDFSKASKELDLAIIRVQYGSTTIDSKYKEYVAGCKKFNIPFGHYAYARFVSVEDAKKEATNFLARIDKEAKFLVVDVEEQTCKSVSELVSATQTFIDVCKKAGYKVGLYTGHHFYKPYQMDKVKADFLWIPRYGAKPDFACDIWQFTDKGSLAGVKGSVDLNQLNGSKLLEYFTGKEIKPVKNGWVKTSTSQWTYYLDGAKKTGWVKDKGKWYFLDSNGIMKTGWIKDKGKWYFLNQSGAMLTGLQHINGKTYFFNAKGEMLESGQVTLSANDKGHLG